MGLDLTVKVQNTPGEIQFNFDELKEALTAQMEIYKGLEITEDKIPEAKADRATLRKIKDAIEDKRKEIKKAAMIPYTEFEKKVKELTAIIDEPIGLINEKLDAFEEARKKEREAEVKAIYKEAVGDWADYLPYEKVFRDKWLNKTTKNKDIEDEISILVINLTNDLTVIEGLKSDIQDDLIKLYKQTGQLSAVIRRNTDYLEAQKRAQEKAAETARVAEIEKAKEEAREEARAEIKETVQDDFMPKPEPSFTFTVYGSANIEKVKQLLEFADINYEIGG